MPEDRPTPDINDKQQRFAREYLVDLNGTQAAIRAGYSPKTAKQQGSRLLTNADVLAAIETGRKRTEIRLELTRDDVIRQYQRLGFSDPRKMFNPNGSLKPITELDDDTAAAIQGFDVETVMSGSGDEAKPVTTVKVKMADRRSALDSIMKAQAWNKTDVGNDANPLTGLLKALGKGNSALPVQPSPPADDEEDGA